MSRRSNATSWHHQVLLFQVFPLPPTNEAETSIRILTGGRSVLALHAYVRSEGTSAVLTKLCMPCLGRDAKVRRFNSSSVCAPRRAHQGDDVSLRVHLGRPPQPCGVAVHATGRVFLWVEITWCERLSSVSGQEHLFLEPRVSMLLSTFGFRTCLGLKATRIARVWVMECSAPAASAALVLGVVLVLRRLIWQPEPSDAPPVDGFAYGFYLWSDVLGGRPIFIDTHITVGHQSRWHRPEDILDSDGDPGIHINHRQWGLYHLLSIHNPHDYFLLMDCINLHPVAFRFQVALFRGATGRSKLNGGPREEGLGEAKALSWQDTVGRCRSPCLRKEWIAIHCARKCANRVGAQGPQDTNRSCQTPKLRGWEDGPLSGKSCCSWIDAHIHF